MVSLATFFLCSYVYESSLNLQFFDCLTLSAILEYAVATKQTQLVAHFFSKVDDWAAAWGLSVPATRKLLQNFSAVLEQEGDKSVTTKALVKYFQTYKSDSGSYPAEVEKLITTAVLSAVNSPVDAFADRVALLEVSNTLHALTLLQ